MGDDGDGASSKSLWNKHWIKGGPARGPRDSARGPRDPGQHAPTPSIIQVQRNPCSNKKEKNVAHTTKKWKSEVSECSTNTPLVPLPIGHTASGRLLTSRFDLTPVPSTLPEKKLFCKLWHHFFLTSSTLQGTNISPEKSIWKMIFLFPRWDMLISWRVTTKI